MTLLEYIKLDDIAKNNQVIENGILIDMYSENDKLFNLFSLHDFFVEVVSCETEQKILDVTPYESGFRFGLRQKEKKEALNSRADLLNYYFLT